MQGGVQGKNQSGDTQGEDFHPLTDEYVSASSEGSLISHLRPSSETQAEPSVYEGNRELHGYR